VAPQYLHCPLYHARSNVYSFLGDPSCPFFIFGHPFTLCIVALRHFSNPFPPPRCTKSTRSFSLTFVIYQECLSANGLPHNTAETLLMRVCSCHATYSGIAFGRMHSGNCGGDWDTTMACHGAMGFIVCLEYWFMFIVFAIYKVPPVV